MVKKNNTVQTLKGAKKIASTKKNLKKNKME